MVKFIGLECARDALADAIHKQLNEDRCICAACYFAHRTMAKSILKIPDKYYAKYRKEVMKDMKTFDDYWKNLDRIDGPHMRCLHCGCMTKIKDEPFKYGTVLVGVFPMHVCKCGSRFFPESSSRAVEEKVKELGLWGKPPPGKKVGGIENDKRKNTRDMYNKKR
jgi:hypothetical protein